MEAENSALTWSLAVLVAVVLILTNSAEFVRDYARTAWMAFRMPGPYAWPIIGNAHWAANSKTLIWAATECPKKFGLVMRAWLSFYPIVFLVDPNHIHRVLSNPKHVEKTRLYKMMQNFLGLGLITCDGGTWKMHRRLMQPYFHANFLDQLVATFAKGGHHLANKILHQIDNGVEQINLTNFVNRAVFSILTEAVLGVPMDSDLSKQYEEESPYRKGSSAVIHRLLHPWLLLSPIFNITEAASNELAQKRNLFEFTKQAMARRKQAKDTSTTCYMDHLLAIHKENPESFTEEDCVNEATTLMLAGQDSVGAALAFSIHTLANNPKHQETVVEEQNAIFEGQNHLSNIEDLKKMQYLDQCIKETLRMYPSVPIIARTLGEDLTLGKYTLPKGCDVFIAPYATHRLPEYFPNAETFDPSRFSAVNTAKRPPCSYLSFSSGPRNCIGYKFAEIEMKAVLSELFRRFEFCPVPGREKPNLSYRITLRASGGLWVRAKIRNQMSSVLTDTPAEA